MLEGIFCKSLYSVDRAPTVVLMLAKEEETLPHSFILISEPDIDCSVKRLPVKMCTSLAASPNMF